MGCGTSTAAKDKSAANPGMSNQSLSPGDQAAAEESDHATAPAAAKKSGRESGSSPSAQMSTEEFVRHVLADDSAALDDAFDAGVVLPVNTLVDTDDGRKLSALHFFIETENANGIQLLCEVDNVDPFIECSVAPGQKPISALIYAMDKGQQHEAICMIDAADSEFERGIVNPPLHHAVRCQLSDVVQRLGEYKEHLDTRDDNGNTPLHLAAKYGHESMCQELVISGALKGVHNDDGMRPLDLLPLGASETLKELLEADDDDVAAENADAKNGHLRSPLGPGSKKRRSGVSAESVTRADFKPMIVPKSSEELASLREMVSGNFLIRILDDEQRTAVLNAMVEKKFDKDAVIIRQGDEGDYFYVVDTGVCDIFVQQGDAEPVKVLTCSHGDSFGELALMYDTPRAATVIAVEDSRLWAVDRLSYKHILLNTTQQRRDQYKEFLDKVPLLESLDNYERYSLADALTEQKFKEGEAIINEGDGMDAANSEFFYIIESGKVVCTKAPQGNDQEEGNSVNVVGRLGAGDYFGELALLTNDPRACTVTATEDVVALRLERSTFERILGPLKSLVANKIHQYEQYESTNALDQLKK